MVSGLWNEMRHTIHIQTILIGMTTSMVKQFRMPGIITEEGHHRSYKYGFLLEIGIIHWYPLQ